MSIASLLVETSSTKNNPSIFLPIFWHYFQFLTPDCILLVIYQLYDNVEQEQSEFTYFNAFVPNLWHIYTLAVCLMLRFPDSSFKGVISYELQKLRIMTHGPKVFFLVQQMQYFNAIVGYKTFKLQTKILQRLKVSKNIWTAMEFGFTLPQLANAAYFLNSITDIWRVQACVWRAVIGIRIYLHYTGCPKLLCTFLENGVISLIFKKCQWNTHTYTAFGYFRMVICDEGCHL